ncbi:MAG: thiamine diphosphokinase [Ruminococcaceae bacterium]|nr:thiamine diphosphokinase [Oscillospiraceae bacterium]
MRAVIFTGGECATGVRIPHHELCVAADSGFIMAKKLGVFPDLIVGDFDSIGDSMPVEYIDAATGRMSEIIRHPAQKNETDTMLAAYIAIERGAAELYIIGGLSGRADHTLSNVFLLEALSDRGISVIYTDGANELRVIRDGEAVHIPHGEYRYFSTLALDECVISAEGCAYPLDRSTLTRADAYAVSNETLACGATVTCHEGKLLLIRSEKL